MENQNQAHLPLNQDAALEDAMDGLLLDALIKYKTVSFTSTKKAEKSLF